MGRLQDEIKQTKPFASPAQEALLSIERTAAVFRHQLGEALKPLGVTPTQYNVLRILRGAGAAGLCRHEVRDRLIAQVPDVTRLLDRMEEAELIVRERDSPDRRLVSTRITRAGLQLLERADRRVREVEAEQIGHLDDDQLRTLIHLLELARGG